MGGNDSVHVLPLLDRKIGIRKMAVLTVFS
jgi:hypothetical protein